MATTKHEREQKELAKLIASKPALAKVALSSFIAAFELLKPPEKKAV